MQHSQSNKPQKLNLDVSKKYLPTDAAFFLLNHEINNPLSLGKSTPLNANAPLCTIEQSGGETYVIGSHYSPITNECYSFHYNSNNIHYILRTTEDDCEIVFLGECLNFSADPKHSIENWRVYLVNEKLETCGNRHGKQLVWVDGLNEICQIDVEASIATNFFTTPFFERCADPCDFIKMCVPQPCGCLTAEYIPLPESEISLTNHLLDVGFQFMYRFVYYDNRASEWSDRSTLYFQDVKGCFDSSEGFSRCMELTIPIGNPLVDRIEIAFSKGDDIWYLTDTVEKYKKYTSSQQKWYERELSEELENYDEELCTFKYKFCNDKQCQTIDPKEIIRVFNPMPREAQGLIPIKNALGFYNYKSGLCPVDKKETQKIKIELDCPEDITTECETEYVKVKVRAIIHNTSIDRNQFIYREGDGDKDDVTDTAKFGGLNKSQTNGGFEEAMGYDQYFNDKTRNFIAYIEGTNYWVEMKQYKAWAFFDTYNDPILMGVVADMGDTNTQIRWRRAARNGEFFFQEAEFRVPKGTKGFIRLASHHATSLEDNTSTFVVGTYPDIRTYKGDAEINNSINKQSEEIFFDTCDAKETLEIYETLVIQDNAVDKGFTNASSAYHGYLKDGDGKPIEGAVIVPFVSDVELPYFETITDHNGFYHTYLESGENGDISLKVRVEKDCNNFDVIKTVSIESSVKGNSELNIVITKDDNSDYQTNSRTLVKVKVEDCNGQPVGGIRVAFSGSKYDITNALGFAEKYIRNYSTRSRNIRAIVMDYKNCFSLGCNGECNPCLDSPIVGTEACYFTTDIPTVNKITTLPTIKINKESAIINRKGLKQGGRYPFGVVVEGKCGRLSAVYEVVYIDVPKAQAIGRVKYCGLKYTSTQTVTLPSWASCLKIVRGINVNPFELQWLIDKVERTSDGKIRLTIQSLNDYNAKYNFKTNTLYQWLKGDRIEFIKNGDGKIFKSATNGILNYLTVSPFHDEVTSEKKTEDVGADYFNQLLIEDDGKLGELKEGALIEIQRSKECTTEPVYYEICASIPVVNGELVYPNGTFTTFDTYLVNRAIGQFPAQVFEHHSPSDFWGDHLDDTGKAHFVNKYENEKRYGRNISINAAGQFNYFGDLVKTFDAPEQGDIVAMDIKDGKIILAIGEHDNFLAQASDDLVRVGADGTIRALPADSIISDGQPKISGQFGCQYAHIGSIYFGDGWARWVDVNKHADVKHDYSIARDVSEGKAKSFYRKRCQEIETWNKKQTDFLNHYRFATGYNKYTNALMSTIKKLRDGGINNEQKPYLKPNDTLLFNPISDEYLTFASFTPEAYSQIDLFDGQGSMFILFLNGQPYVHPLNADKWNEFFGIAVDRVVSISINKFPEKIKRPISIELQDEVMWYVTEVTTDTPNFLSEIPPKRPVKNENKWNMSFLGNINSRTGLYGNEQARGYYTAATFIRENTVDKKYKVFDNNKRIIFDELDSIICKFMLSSQSGMDENL